jgi:excisionase family DNA binding protein
MYTNDHKILILHKRFIMEELLTIDDVAKLLKISKASVRRHIKEGRLKAVRIGRIIRIPAGGINALFTPVSEVEKPKGGLDWFERCRELSREIKKRHGGVLLEDSSETIRNLREGRALIE